MKQRWPEPIISYLALCSSRIGWKKFLLQTTEKIFNLRIRLKIKMGSLDL